MRKQRASQTPLLTKPGHGAAIQPTLIPLHSAKHAITRLHDSLTALGLGARAEVGLIAAKPASLLDLQRACGNRAVRRLMGRARYAGATPIALARAGSLHAVEELAQGATDLRTIQRQADGQASNSNFVCSEPQKDPQRRCIPDKLRLQASFWDSESEATRKRLHEAFHNDPPLEQSGGQDAAVLKAFKRALNTVDNVSHPTSPPLNVDSGWDDPTKTRVFQFQVDNRIPAGGFEAGRKTLLALDAHLQQDPKPPKPDPDPNKEAPQLKVTACEPNAAGDRVQVSGAKFSAGGAITLFLDSKLSGFAIADQNGSFSFQVPTNGVAQGQHDLLAISGTNQVATASLALPCTPEKPQPGPFNQTLEDVLDAIGVEHNRIYQHAQNALVRLEVDLQPSLQEAPSDLAIRLLGRAAVDVIAALFAPGIKSIADAIVKDLENRVGSDTAQGIVDWAVTPVLAGVVDSVKGTTEDAVKDGLAFNPTDRTAQLGAFIDGQKAGLLEQQSSKEEEYIQKSKPKARQVPKKAPACPDPDPRVCAAQADLNSLRATERDRRDAFNKTYTAAAEEWTVWMAKAAVGQKDKDKPTDLGGKVDLKDARGMLTLEYRSAKPVDPFQIAGGTIAGLSEITRGKLNEQIKDTKIGDIGIPRVATGCVNLELSRPGSGCPGKFEVAKNEAGNVFARDANTLGEGWLKEKGFRFAGSPTTEAGAAAVWAQIDALLVKSLNGGKGIEKP